MSDPKVYERIDTEMGEVLIREFTPKDIHSQILYFYESPHEFLEEIGYAPSQFPEQNEFEAQRLRRLEDDERSGKPRMLAAALRGEMVGYVFICDREMFCGLHKVFFHIIRPDLRGKGLGIKMARAAFGVFAELHEIDRVIAEPSKFLAGANSALKKLGARFIGYDHLPPGPLTAGGDVARYEVQLK